MLRALWAAGLLTLVGGLAAVPYFQQVAPGDGDGPDSEVDRSADLRRLEEWILMERSFTPERRAEATRTVAGHLREVTRFTEPEFYMEVRRVTAMAENGHSNVSGAPIYNRFGIVPLRTYWFADGLYVVRARTPHEHLLGARIEAIEGVGVADLAVRLMEYHGGSAAKFRRYSSLPLMLAPALLHAIGIGASADELKLAVVERDGDRSEVTVAAEPGSPRVPRASPWRYLHPAPIVNEDGSWKTALPASAQVPLFMRDEGKPFRYVHLSNEDLVYIQLRANIGRAGNSVRDFVADARARLDRDRPCSIVFDNRQNAGGDLTRTADFALALPQLASRDGRVYGASFRAARQRLPHQLFTADARPRSGLW